MCRLRPVHFTPMASALDGSWCAAIRGANNDEFSGGSGDDWDAAENSSERNHVNYYYLASV